MGTSGSREKRDGARRRSPGPRAAGRLRRGVSKHCELGPGLFVGAMEMQSAIVTYLDLLGLRDARTAHAYSRGGLMFDMFA